MLTNGSGFVGAGIKRALPINTASEGTKKPATSADQRRNGGTTSMNPLT